MNIAEWARTFAKHKALCHEFFGGRSDAIIEQSKLLSKNTTLGPIEALDLCMQIEVEFPNRIEEFLDRSGLHPNGRLVGLQQYITHVRKNG